MREIKIKDKNGTLYKTKGRLATGVYSTVEHKEIYEGDILEVTEVMTDGNRWLDEKRAEWPNGDFSISSIETYVSDVKYESGEFILSSEESDYYDSPLAIYSTESTELQPMYKTRILGSIDKNPEL